MAIEEICFMRATELACLIRKGELSAREVMAAHLIQIKPVNPRVNAIVTFGRAPVGPCFRASHQLLETKALRGGIKLYG